MACLFVFVLVDTNNNNNIKDKPAFKKIVNKCITIAEINWFMFYIIFTKINNLKINHLKNNHLYFSKSNPFYTSCKKKNILIYFFKCQKNTPSLKELSFTSDVTYAIFCLYPVID